MAIYQLFEQEKKETFTDTFDSRDLPFEKPKKGGLFSTLVTRFCFFLLLLVDTAWFFWNLFMISLALTVFAITLGKFSPFKKFLIRSFLHLRRSVVCYLALLIGLFSPSFGIIVACTYFLMYDKEGMQQVVPTPLQAQFKDIFKN